MGDRKLVKFRLALPVKMLIGGHRLSGRISSLVLSPLVAALIEETQLVATRLAEYSAPGSTGLTNMLKKENRYSHHLDHT